MQRKLYSSGAVFVFLIGVILFQSAPAADEFYKNKTLRFIVGFSAGGGFDTYTRTIARHIGRHIPGKPDAIVQNMTGAGSLIAAHHIYSKAKPDGLTIGVWHPSLVFQQALGAPAIRFDARRFGWVGAPTKGFRTCAVMGFAKIATFAELLAPERPLKMGANAPGSGSHSSLLMLQTILGAEFGIVAGYKGTSKLRLAMQSREIDGACFGWETMRSTARAMLDARGDERLIPLATSGNNDDPEVAHLPRIRDFIEVREKRAWYDAWDAISGIQRALSVPPETPAQRLAVLRKAFLDTMRDPVFLADAEKSDLLIMATGGSEVERRVNEILALSEDAKQALQFMIKK